MRVSPAQKLGLRYVTDDRLGEGIVGPLPVGLEPLPQADRRAAVLATRPDPARAVDWSDARASSCASSTSAPRRLDARRHALGRQRAEDPARSRAELRPEGRRLPQADLRAGREDDRDRARPDPTSSPRAAAPRSSSRPTSTSCSRSPTGSRCSRAGASSGSFRNGPGAAEHVGAADGRRATRRGGAERRDGQRAPPTAAAGAPTAAANAPRSRERVLDVVDPLARARRARARRRRDPSARARPQSDHLLQDVWQGGIERRRAGRTARSGWRRCC